MAVADYEKKYETVVGSWYNSGFHGHYRSLPRNYYNTFREICKPTPPRKFSARLSEGTWSHPFTKHDNKKRFLNDVDQLVQNGLKKDPERSDGKFNPRLITWDKKHDPKRYISCYRADSRSTPLDLHIKECMKDWEPLGQKMEFNTMYREHYCRRPTIQQELRAQTTGDINTSQNHGATPPHKVRRKRPNTTNLVTRQRMLDLRPEWMGSTMVKQRNQSEINLANEYHGYSNQWDKDSMYSDSRRSSISSRDSRRSSICSRYSPPGSGYHGEMKEQGTNTGIETANREY